MKGAFGAALALTAMLCLSACADASATFASSDSALTTASIKPAGAATARGNGVVYLLRGGLNIFSTGMDELAVKLRARGVDARSDGHAHWERIAAEARQHYAATKAPIVLVGHSWGALAAILIANDLAKANVPVALIILYDTTDSVKVPPNVRHVINLESSTALGLHLTVTGEYGFAGKIDNVPEPQFDHLDLDNAAPVHDLSIAEVLKVIRPRR